MSCVTKSGNSLFINSSRVDEIRKTFKKGTRIRILHMNDVQAPPYGTLGTVRFVDDIGTVHMEWDTGGSLGLIPDEDEFEIVL